VCVCACVRVCVCESVCACVCVCVCVCEELFWHVRSGMSYRERERGSVFVSVCA